MQLMPTNDEKAAFSKRLELALRRSPEPVKGATELALRFNLRYAGTAVSPQTVHKWLSARAIPTPDKLETLAKWLKVDEHWLHYGPSPASTEEGNKGKSVKAALPSTDAIKLAQKIQALPPHRRYLLEELVSQLKDDL
jgi:transcriptional regulator with XRE-family HTH domain